LAKAAPNLVREGAQLFRGTEDMESAAALTRQVGEGEGGAAQTSRVLGAAGDMGGAGPKALPPGGVNSWTGPILSRVTQSPETMYRVWGGGSSRVGQWLTPFKPVSAQTAREGLALPPGNTASFVSEVTVPTGTRIQVGTAGAAFGQPGGAAQVQLLDRIAPELFGEGQPLTPLLEASTI
jgi:hypothetical protein